ncbi:hypothetical protein LCGC14_2433110 [marine sediment metagenome]|uniref:Uncharacterized protein n=1 Tax=marine sediment metagenome TaxID=412755 RepID=A0A0F9BLE2_9ZZZZ
MSREDVFRVRHDTIPSVAESSGTEGIINRIGAQIVTDFVTQLTLSGYAYHMQVGSENVGVASTLIISDTLVSMVADNSAGNAMIPLLYECTPGVIAGATIVQAMLEADKDKVRWASNGAAFVPANMRTDDPHSANGTFYIIDAAGVITAAKSAVPNSVELARQDFLENALTNTLGYPGTWDTVVYSIRKRPTIVLLDASSLVAHFGSASADITGYSVLQFAQFPKAMVV